MRGTHCQERIAMPQTPESGRTDDAVTCPRCLLFFVSAEEPAAPMPPSSGTITVHPDEASNCPLEAAPSPTPVPERIGRFAVRRFVGEGSFGRVYEAFDSTLKRV